MSLIDRIQQNQEIIAVVGLGYVGMPVAISFAKKATVVGYDIDEDRICKYKQGIDPAREISKEIILRSNISFTEDDSCLRDAGFIIVTVPTPINKDHTPDLSPIITASKSIGQNLKEGTIVVYESTVFPGCTEEICVPILEKESGLKCGSGFYVGYSPERINPGDKIHRFENICKIVAACDSATLKEICDVYELVVEAGTYPVSSIKTAEAIKVIENTQRDINIAFMNETAKALNCLGIDTNEVIDGMNTKWNALGFRPGLVGGHCVSVDPYYYAYETEKKGFHSQMITDGRLINESMPDYIAENVIEEMALAKIAPTEANVVILGLTFKENCSDIRNSKVCNLVKSLNSYGVDPIVIDPYADKEEAEKRYGIMLKSLADVENADCIIVAVAHNTFRDLGVKEIKTFFRTDEEDKRIIIDVKGIYSAEEMKASGLRYWRL